MPANVYHMTIGHATWKNVKTKTLTVFPGHLRNIRALPLEIHLWASSCLVWLLSSHGPPSAAPLRITSVLASCLAMVVQTVKRNGKIKGETSQSRPSELQTISLPPALKRMACLSAITRNRSHTVRQCMKKSQKAVKAEQKEETDLNGSTVKRGKVLINAVKLQMNSQAGYMAGWC